jgi:hypothetical protein
MILPKEKQEGPLGSGTKGKIMALLVKTRNQTITK